MRTFNGLQVFTQQLTNTGQLDLRYPRITGNDQGANLILGDNIQSNYNFYSDTNFNVTNYINIFYCTGTNGSYTASLPNITDKKTIIIKNLKSTNPLIITGYNTNQIFDNSDSTLALPAPASIALVGVINNNYTGWVCLESTAGIS
jgi:hypothetical protein